MIQDGLKGDLCIRPMMHSDFMIMVKWFNDSRVLDFYEGPSDLNKVINKYGQRIEGKHYVVPCIVEYKTNPIGYIQYYELQEDELKTYGFLKNQKIFGIDQFIGETQLWGKGLGTSMILMMLKYLCENKSASKVVLEVETSNKRAVASYKKCGFTIIKKLNNNLYLMEWLPTKAISLIKLTVGCSRKEHLLFLNSLLNKRGSLVEERICKIPWFEPNEGVIR